MSDDGSTKVPRSLCNECGSDWTLGNVGPDCKTCGGFALVRPCPMCSGSCGSIWKRAVLDSLDHEEAHWVGSCTLNAENP